MGVIPKALHSWFWITLTLISYTGIIYGYNTDANEDEKLEGEKKPTDTKFSAQFLKDSELAEITSDLVITEKSFKFSVEVQKSSPSTEHNVINHTRETSKVTATTEHSNKINTGDDEFRTTKSASHFNFSKSIKISETTHSPILNKTSVMINKHNSTSASEVFIEEGKIHSPVFATKEEYLTTGKENNNKTDSIIDLVYSQPYEDSKGSLDNQNVTIVYPDINSEYIRTVSNTTKKSNDKKDHTMKQNERNENRTTEKKECEKPCVKSFFIIKRRRQGEIKRLEKVSKKITEMRSTTETSTNRVRHYLFTRRPIKPFILRGRTNKTKERLNELMKQAPDLIPHETENVQSTVEFDRGHVIEVEKENGVEKRAHEKTKIQSLENNKITGDENRRGQASENFLLTPNEHSSSQEQIPLESSTDFFNRETILNGNLMTMLDRKRQITPENVVTEHNNREGNQSDDKINANLRLINNSNVSVRIDKTRKPFIPSPEYNPEIVNKNTSFNRLNQTKDSFLPLYKDLHQINNENENIHKIRTSNNQTRKQLSENMMNMMTILKNLRQFSRRQQMINSRNNQENINITDYHHNTENNNTGNGNHNYFNPANYEIKKITPKLRANETEQKRKETNGSTNIKLQTMRFRMIPVQQRNQTNSPTNQARHVNRNSPLHEEKLSGNNSALNNSTNNFQKELEVIEQILRSNILIEFEKIRAMILNNRNQQNSNQVNMNNRLRNKNDKSSLNSRLALSDQEGINQNMARNTHNIRNRARIQVPQRNTFHQSNSDNYSETNIEISKIDSLNSARNRETTVNIALCENTQNNCNSDKIPTRRNRVHILRSRRRRNNDKLESETLEQAIQKLPPHQERNKSTQNYSDETEKFKSEGNKETISNIFTEGKGDSATEIKYNLNRNEMQLISENHTVNGNLNTNIIKDGEESNIRKRNAETELVDLDLEKVRNSIHSDEFTQPKIGERGFTSTTELVINTVGLLPKGFKNGEHKFPEIIKKNLESPISLGRYGNEKIPYRLKHGLHLYPEEHFIDPTKKLQKCLTNK